MEDSEMVNTVIAIFKENYHLWKKHFDLELSEIIERSKKYGHRPEQFYAGSVFWKALNGWFMTDERGNNIELR